MSALPSTEQLLARAQALMSAHTPHGVVPAYIAHGWKLCAIPPGSKAPRSDGWNLVENALASAAVLPPDWNIGLLHAYSGTCAIDLDDMFMAQVMFAERGIDLQALLDAPDACQVVSGRQGSGKLLYALSDPLQSRSIKLGPKTIVEFRCATADGLSVQDVLSPSRHPSGTTYQWAGSGSWQALPPLPAEIRAWWEELLVVPDHVPATGSSTLENLEEVRSALKAIPANCSHDEWLECIMALHSTNHADAYELAREWSMTCPEKYPGDTIFNKRWNSFKDKVNKITIASLFHHAKEHGWVAPPVDVIELFKGDAPEATPEAPRSSSSMKPIPKLLLPVQSFDYNLLPPVFAEWVKDTAERKCWSPDYLAVAIIVVAGMLIGRKACVAPMGIEDDWHEFPNSWGLFVGLPSAAKSPAISTVFSFIAPMVTAAEDIYNLRKKEYDSEKEFHEAEIKALEAKRLALLKGNEKNSPDKGAAREIHREIGILNDQFKLKVPKKKRYYTTDATAEKLVEIFYDNPQGVGFLADEFTRLLKQMLTDNFSTLRGTLLSSWNGKTPHTVDRISGDRDGKTSVLCTSVLGGIQPGMLQLLMGDNEEDGLAQRFGLMVWPDGVTATVEASRPPADGLSAKVEHVLHRLNAIDMTDEPRIIPFDSVAAKAFNHWRCKMLNDIENGITDLAEGIFLSKYPKLLCALSLIFAMCDGEVEAIPMSALERAMRWEPYLRSHLQRVINYASSRSDVHARNIIDKLKRGVVGMKDEKSGYVYTSPRDLQHKELPGCDTATKARELLDWLAELNYVQPGGKGSVKSVREPYFVNPEVFD